MENRNEDCKKKNIACKRRKSFTLSLRNKETNMWRSISLSNVMDYPEMRSDSSALSPRKSSDLLNDRLVTDNSSNSVVGVTSKASGNKVYSTNRNSIVTIVLVEAKGLPPVLRDSATHKLFCKFRLGSESYKTKAVANTARPKWRERFRFRQHRDDILKITVWDSGTPKNFMGSCIIDLSLLEKERTHDIWQQLDDGYGFIHVSITICLSSTNDSSLTRNLEDLEQTQYMYDLRSSWQLIGTLRLNIFGAKGLVGKINSYCIIELDNERVQTPKEGPSSEPTWNKHYMFNVYDVTSTLNLKLYGRSLTSALLYEPIGKISIPLLMVVNGERRWYALKDRNNSNIAKGNCPRIHLQITLTWNPIKASMMLFRPKPVKHVKKSKKYDVARIYHNAEFIEKLFNFLYDINEGFKRLFEWDDPQSSLIALCGWLFFCLYIRIWTIPLLLLLPFAYYCFCYRYRDNKYVLHNSSNTLNGDTISNKNDKGLSGKLVDFQHTTVVVVNGVEYVVSVVERLYNLLSFKVPFLSYLTMILLAIASVAFYFIPFNYILMTLGIYKYTRKYLNPDRVLNNDLIDFLSRIPDNKLLKDWKDRSVPDLVHKQTSEKIGKIQ